MFIRYIIFLTICSADGYFFMHIITFDHRKKTEKSQKREKSTRGRRDLLFGFNDMIKFFVSFLIILPMVSVIHVAGHSFMAMLFGGKASLDIGMGKRLLKVGPIQVRRIYFIDSFCKFGELRIDNRLTSALVYSGGCLFNLASIFLINLLIIKDVLEPNLFFYQFVYFSTYYVFFALLPVQYGDNKLSDGLAVYKVLRYGERCEINN